MFGSGNFALGGVLGIRDLGDTTDIVLVTRTPRSEKSQKQIDAIRTQSGYCVKPEGEEHSFFVPVEHVLFFDNESDFRRLTELVRDTGVVIIGTSVGKGPQPEIAAQIARLISALGDLDGPPFVVFRFENELAACWDEETFTDAGRRIYMPQLVVDRICRNMDVVFDSESGRPTLLVEPESYRRIDCALPDFGSELRGWTEQIRHFVESMQIRVQTDIESYSLLKAWNINGAQAVLCAYAQYAGYEELQDYFGGIEHSRNILANICEEYLEASLALLPEIPEDEVIAFSRSSFNRLLSAKDRVGGILHQWESDITAHQRKLERRVGLVISYLDSVDRVVVARGYKLLVDPPPKFRRLLE
ncbi:hypothetical protein [Mycolicibacterium wolinskyi]|uniref:hypothetical protein n=1 Tax=Mycolicibacterium wolinskyi TaxID=59750 RepID=UPI00391798AA